MPTSRSTERLVEALVSLGSDEPLRLRVSGSCMAPLVADGAWVEIKPSRFYWPADVVAFRSADGRLLLHRVLGYRPRSGGLEFVTQGDASPRSDAPISACAVIGRVVGGEVAPAVVSAPVVHRIRALARFAGLVLRRTASSWTGRAGRAARQRARTG